MFNLHKIRFNLSDEPLSSNFFPEFGESAPPLVERCSCTICVKEHSKTVIHVSFLDVGKWKTVQVINELHYPHTFCCFPPFLVITLRLPQEVSGYCRQCFFVIFLKRKNLVDLSL